MKILLGSTTVTGNNFGAWCNFTRPTSVPHGGTSQAGMPREVEPFRSLTAVSVPLHGGSGLLVEGGGSLPNMAGPVRDVSAMAKSLLKQIPLAGNVDLIKILIDRDLNVLPSSELQLEYLQYLTLQGPILPDGKNDLSACLDVVHHLVLHVDSNTPFIELTSLPSTEKVDIANLMSAFHKNSVKLVEELFDESSLTREHLIMMMEINRVYALKGLNFYLLKDDRDKGNRDYLPKVVLNLLNVQNRYSDMGFFDRAVEIESILEKIRHHYELPEDLSGWAMGSVKEGVKTSLATEDLGPKMAQIQKMTVDHLCRGLYYFSPEIYDFCAELLEKASNQWAKDYRESADRYRRMNSKLMKI